MAILIIILINNNNIGLTIIIIILCLRHITLLLNTHTIAIISYYLVKNNEGLLHAITFICL